MTSSRPLITFIAALAFGDVSAQLGNAPPSAFSHQSPVAVPKSQPLTPAQMAKPSAATPSALPPPANNANVSPEKRAAAGAVVSITDERLTATSPRRALLIQQQEALRTQQEPIGQSVRSSPNTGIAPGGFEGTGALKNYAASYTPQNAAGAKIHKLTDPGIALVNGKQSAVRVTPGGKLLIQGYGFGDARGNASLVGGGLDRQPLMLLLSKWSNEAIEASIPGGTRGVPDEPVAGLKVVTTSGAAYRFDGIGFVAAREETTLTGGATVQKFFDWAVDTSWLPTSWLSGNGAVDRFDSGRDIDCKRPGTDRLRFKTVNGFEVIGATMGHGRTDSGDRDESGNAGSRAFFPGYSFGSWGADGVLEVRWGVFRSHTSPKVNAGVNQVGVVPVPGVGYGGASDSCSSAYTITSLRLYGPAGVPPL